MPRGVPGPGPSGAYRALSDPRNRCLSVAASTTHARRGAPLGARPNPHSPSGEAGGLMLFLPACPALRRGLARGGRSDGFLPVARLLRIWFDLLLSGRNNQTIQLLAVDHSARASMKNAASCEN